MPRAVLCFSVASTSRFSIVMWERNRESERISVKQRFLSCSTCVTHWATVMLAQSSLTYLNELVLPKVCPSTDSKGVKKTQTTPMLPS